MTFSDRMSLATSAMCRHCPGGSVRTPWLEWRRWPTRPIWSSRPRQSSLRRHWGVLISAPRCDGPSLTPTPTCVRLWHHGPPSAEGSAVVGELDSDLQVGTAQHRHDCLQVVLGLAGHPQLVSLDEWLHVLAELLADQLGDLLGLLLADPVLQRGLEAVFLAGELGFLVAEIQGLERDVALDQLGLEDVKDREHALLRISLDQDVLSAPLDGGSNVLEVVALGDLLLGLGQRVADPVPEGDLPALRLQERWSLHRVERREHPDQG